jgi:hypothetical protein
MLKKAAVMVIAAAGLSTALIGLATINSPVSGPAVGIVAWALSPYGYLAVLIRAVTRKSATIAALVLSLLTGGFGVWGLADAMFIHPDAQGGLVFISGPLWQWVGLLLATVPVLWLNRRS